MTIQKSFLAYLGRLSAKRTAPHPMWFYWTEGGHLALVISRSGEYEHHPWRGFLVESTFFGKLFLSDLASWTDDGIAFWADHSIPRHSLAQPLFPASHLFRKLNPPPTT